MSGRRWPRRRWRPSPRSWPRCCGTRWRGRRPRRRAGLTRVGMTLASVVISGAMRRPSSALRSAKLSTSPLSEATTKGASASPSSELSTGWALGWLMMPTDAQRVCPSTTATAGRTRRPGAAGRRPGGRRAAPGCCRPARRSRRPPCRRTTGGRRPPAPCPSGTGGRRPGPRSRPTMAGLSTSRPWWRTRTCSPAESRPRTSSRSMADSACWIDVYASVAAPARLAAGQVGDGAGGADAVLLDRPHARP